MHERLHNFLSTINGSLSQSPSVAERAGLLQSGNDPLHTYRLWSRSNQCLSDGRLERVAYFFLLTSHRIRSVISYSQTAESSTPLREMAYSALASQGYIRQVHAQPPCLFGDSDFHVPTLLFLVAGAYLPPAFGRAGPSARDWRSALSKGCSSRLSLRHLLGIFTFFIIKDLFLAESRQRTSSYIIIEAATTVSTPRVIPCWM